MFSFLCFVNTSILFLQLKIGKKRNQIKLVQTLKNENDLNSHKEEKKQFSWYLLHVFN